MPSRAELNFWKRALGLRRHEDKLALPNLIGVGAPRCGTTSLYSLFNTSPDIHMSPVKEIGYFSKHHEFWSVEEYGIFFLGGNARRYRGEVSPQYLSSEAAPERIRSLIPDCKIVIQLRNPVTRTISQYRHHHKRHKIDDIDAYFENGLAEFAQGDFRHTFKRPAFNLRNGLYAAPLARYAACFPADQVKILAFDDLVDNSDRLYDELEAWLGVTFGRENMPHVSASTPHAEEDGPSPAVRRRLVNFYREDFDRSCEMIGRSPGDFVY